jgi:hypothetical protein
MITSIETITLNPDDILVVTVDTENLPRAKAEEFLKTIQTNLITKYSITNKILCITNKIKLTKIEQTKKEN